MFVVSKPVFLAYVAKSSIDIPILVAASLTFSIIAGVATVLGNPVTCKKLVGSSLV